MSGIFGTMNIANTGLQAMQSAVNTTANNISNAQTEGYSRKRVNLVTNTPFHLNGIGEISTGVRIEGVTRIRDAFTDRQVRIETGRFNTYEAQNGVYDRLEIIFNEPSETGISDAMQQMWNAWQELSKTPESITARTIVVEQSTTMADRFNHTAAQLESLKSETLYQIQQNAFEINTKFEQLTAVDTQIRSAVNREMVPNDLMDQRDLLLDQLSALVKFTVKDREDGGIDLNMNQKIMMGDVKPPQFSVVQRVESALDQEGNDVLKIEVAMGGDLSRVKTFELRGEAASEAAHWREGWLVVSEPSADPDFSIFQVLEPGEGRAKGHQNMLKELEAYSQKLDQLAAGIADLVNQVHRDESGVNFFMAKDGSGTITAATLQVNGMLRSKPEAIAAGKSYGSDAPSGDGSRALAIAALRDVSLGAENYNRETMRFAAGKGDTADARYRALVAGLGVDAAYSRTMQDNETSLLNQLHQRRESVMGVSIDEEITALVKFQNGYQANARVMTTLTQMLDTLINMVR